MAAIHDLLAQIQDEALRKRIEQEVDKLSKQKKFGLVFEEHLPECTPLYDMPIKIGSKVMLRNNKEDKCLYVAIKIDEYKVTCCQKDNPKEQKDFNISELVRVAEFGEAVYPCLYPIDSICNAPESEIWHALIEADNYHALQLLEYLYAGKVDCIYIDPPYNTGARDWKYNNNYVDGTDAYRHSKWLSFIQKRLVIAKRLLNPDDSVLIVTIDEKEYLHLGCLLEEIFPQARIQMISDVIHPSGVARTNQFSRVDEYIFFVSIGDSKPVPTEDSMLDFEMTGDYKTQAGSSITWRRMIRAGSNSSRERSENCFYPIFVDEKTEKIHSIGFPPGKGVSKDTVQTPDGCVAVWPIHSNGEEGVWQISRPKLITALENGTARLGRKNSAGSWAMNYLSEGMVKEIESGHVVVKGRDENGALILERAAEKVLPAKSVWNKKSHDATQYGSYLINGMLGKRFTYPKSLYATHDTIKFYVANKPNALIVDFFAGSGTTLHAVNLLNKEDNGNRRCILVTNNEVSEGEAKQLLSRGIHPGDDEWEKLGIARYVTWPRTVCSILGKDVEDNPIKGEYIGTDFNMADGFKANAVFFKLGFLDKTSVALGLQFSNMLSMLWMKAGAIGPCPTIETDSLPPMMILPENKFAVLLDENYYSDFSEALRKKEEIQTVFLVTDYDVNYRSMVKDLNVKTTYQLYRDYLDNFRINSGRNIR